MGLQCSWLCAGLLVFSGLARGVDLPRPTISGYASADAGREAKLFYMYYEAQEPLPHIVDDTPILIWLNGGPGCTSMIGNFYEIGPQRVTSNGSLVDFEFTWNKDFALLFLDQPVGTGLSAGSAVPRSQLQVVMHAYHALNDFFVSHPHLKSRPVYLTGESYAGHYIPALARFIIERQRRAPDHRDGWAAQRSRERLHMPDPAGSAVFRLAGVAIGSGFVEPRAQVQTHADVMYALGLLDDAQRAKAEEQQELIVRLIDEDQWDAAHRARENLLSYLEAMSGVATLLDVRRSGLYRDAIVANYLNHEEVRLAIGAPPGDDISACNSSIPWIMTNDIMKGYAQDIAGVLDHIPVLLFQGQFDVKDGYASNLAWIKKLDRQFVDRFERAERKVWKLNEKRIGYVKKYGRLTQVLVLDAGHMVPHDAPEAALAMIRAFIADHE